mgnify:FL=1
MSAVNLSIDEDGICSSCKNFDKFNEISEENWLARKNKLLDLVKETKKKEQKQL